MPVYQILDNLEDRNVLAERDPVHGEFVCVTYPGGVVEFKQYSDPPPVDDVPN